MKSLVILILIISATLSIGISYAYTQIGDSDGAYVEIGKKIGFDGTAGRNYIYEPFNGRLQFYTGTTSPKLAFTVSEIQDFWFPANKRIFLDGGMNTFIVQPVQGRIQFYTGLGGQPSRLALSISEVQDVWISNGKKLYLDGGANSYLTSPGSGQIAIFSNKIQTITANNGNVGIGTNTPAQKLDVNGNIQLTGNIVSPNDICIGTCS